MHLSLHAREEGEGDKVVEGDGQHVIMVVVMSGDGSYQHVRPDTRADGQAHTGSFWRSKGLECMAKIYGKVRRCVSLETFYCQELDN